MPVLKKVKLKRGLRRVHAVDTDEEDERMAREEREELKNRMLKIGTAWRYVESRSKRGNVPKPIENYVDDEEENQISTSVLEEEEEASTIIEIPPGAILVPARDHPEFAPFIRMVEAGVEVSAVAAVMNDSNLDSSVLKNPLKKVILLAHLRKKEKKIDDFNKYSVELETEEEAAAAQEKINFFSKRRPLEMKLDPNFSIQKREQRLLQMADCVALHNQIFQSFVWRHRLGDENLGYTIDTNDFALTKGVISLLGPRLKSTETVQDGFSVKTENDDETNTDDISALSIRRKRPIEPAGLDTNKDKNEQLKQQFKHGNFIYKLERSVYFLQVLGYLASLNLDWPIATKNVLNWTTILLDVHLRPLLYIHKFLYKIKKRKNMFATQKVQQQQQHRRNALSTKYAPNSVVDLYFYRDIIKYLYSLSLAAILLAVFYFLWQIGDYTNPKITDQWIHFYIEKWWSQGIPRSLCWFMFFMLIFIGIPASILTFSQKNQHYENGMLIAFGSFALYLWLFFIVCTTMWSKYFRSKLSHNKSYAAITVLKETINAKFTLIFILFFLTYLPTCFYIFGGLLPIHSIKVWDRHGSHSATEPLEFNYYHTACYFLSFPPRIRPKKSRSRKKRIVPPGFASYPPHPYHTHYATNRIDCTNTAGILLFTLSSIALVLYVLGLPLFILHLTKIATTQLHFCDWWQNYLTAWRRFRLVSRECEKHHLIEVIITSIKLWKHDTKQKWKALVYNCLNIIPQIFHTIFLQSKNSSISPLRTSNTFFSRHRQEKDHYWYCFCFRKKKTSQNHKSFVAKYDPRDHIPTKGYRFTLYRISQLRIFNFIIAVAVFISLLPILTTDDDTILNFVVLWVCGLLFLLEFQIKIIALNVRLYFHSWFNCLDFSLVILWFLEVAQQGATNLNFLRSLRALRSARMIRMARMARTLRLLKLGHHIDPILHLIKLCVIQWIADTPLSNALLDKLEASGKAAPWRIRTSLPAKIEKMKLAFLHAKREYSISVDEFERDHELIIDDIDIIIDTSALTYLIRSYKGNVYYWRIILLFETLLFAAIMSWLKISQLVWKQCLGGALVLLFFVFLNTLKRPYMYLHERYVDQVTRSTIIIILLLGMMIDLVPKKMIKFRHILDGMCLVSIFVCFFELFYLLRMHEMFKNLFQGIMHYLDAVVLSLFTGSIEIKCYAMENSNYGLRLIQQWDELLKKQGFFGWPHTSPQNLLTFKQKLFYIRWAALRKLYLSKFRTPTGQCILHIAMLKGEPEAVAWILHHHPDLLKVADDQRDTPVIIALKELAKTLLKHNESPSVKTEWKRSKLAEILLSDQIQNYLVPWNLPHYRSLGDIAIPFYGELIQQLSLALNLQPPAGFVRISKWIQYPGDIPEFLGQCFLACRDRIEVSSNELGDFGKRTFQSLLRAMAVTKTSITIPSNFFTFYPIHIIRFVATYNRLDDDAGKNIAQCIITNQSLNYLDLRHNYFADISGILIAQAIIKNKSLTLVSLAHNRLGAKCGLEFAQMIAKNQKLKSLNFAFNRLGARLYWKNFHTKIFIESSGPALCAALEYNYSLTYLNISDNLLGPTTAIALDKALRHNKQNQILSLGLAGNCLAQNGGKALARVLKSVSLTHLDASRNNFDTCVGTAFASSLKKNDKLLYLDLSQNYLDTNAGKSIALALEQNCTLTILYAHNNNFGPDVLRAFSTMLQRSSTLISLGLAYNKFGIASFQGGNTNNLGSILNNALQINTTLTHLDLRGLGFSAESLNHLIIGIGQNRSLIKINLDDQLFDNAAVLQLTNSLDRIRQFIRSKMNKTSFIIENQALMNFGGLGDKCISNGLNFIGLNNCDLGPRAGPIAIGAILALKNIRELSIANNNMGPKLAEQIGQFLQGDQCTLKILNLAQNNLGETGGLTLARALERNISLTDLNLSNNELTPIVGMALADALCELIESGTTTRISHITKINLNDNCIGTQATEDLLFALRNPSVRAIFLARNFIQASAGTIISTCLRRNTIQWRYLDLQGNQLGKDGVNPIFWALRRNVSLIHLNLSDNNIGPDFGTERDEIEHYGNSLAAAIEYNYSLQTLQLANNNISFECGIILTQALEQNPSLTEINFQGNSLDAIAAQSIATKIQNDYQIRQLNLRRNYLGWEGGVALANSLGLNDTLIFLDLSFNDLGAGGPIAGISIGHAVARNACLRHLSLGSCLVGPEAGMIIAESLEKNNTLITLDVTDNHFDIDVGTAFLKFLAHNSAILDLRLSSVEVGDDICSDVASLMKIRAITKGMATTDFQNRLDSAKASLH